MSKLSASCHCGAVRFEVEAPEWVMDCNCSHNGNDGVFWTHTDSPTLPSHDEPVGGTT